MQNPEHLLPDRPDQTVILVAEDDVVVQNVVRITLERDGYFVLTADDGHQALLLSRKFPGDIHLLISDIDMPKMDGIELSNYVSKERPGICVILMSGSRKISHPNVVFLDKPFGPRQLSQTVRGLLPVCIPK